MNIKELKGQPLLQSPKGESWEWARMTAEDEDKIRALLASKREEACPSVAKILYEMKELGIPAAVDTADVKNMRGELDQYRGVSKFADATGHGLEEAEKFIDGEGIARTHYYMRGLGVGEPVTERDERLMMRALQERRDRGTASLAMMLVWMKGLDLGVGVTWKDRMNLSHALPHHREDRFGTLITCLHYHMKALGLGEPVTREDEAKMREDLRELRGQTRKRSSTTQCLNPEYDLPKALLWVANLLPADRGGDKHELPPLRRFRR